MQCNIYKVILGENNVSYKAVLLGIRIRAFLQRHTTRSYTITFLHICEKAPYLLRGKVLWFSTRKSGNFGTSLTSKIEGDISPEAPKPKLSSRRKAWFKCQQKVVENSHPEDKVPFHSSSQTYGSIAGCSQVFRYFYKSFI